LSTVGFIVGGYIRSSHLVAIVLAAVLIARLRPGHVALGLLLAQAVHTSLDAAVAVQGDLA
jgi:hypothetical protein